MEINITARNLSVSDRFRDYVAERAHKVEQLAHKVQSLEIKVTRHDHSKTSGPEDQVELTVIEPGHVIRAEAHAGDKFSAFDMAFGKLSERLRRAADRRKVHHGAHGSIGTSELTANDFASLDIHAVDADVLLGKASDAAERAPGLSTGQVIDPRQVGAIELLPEVLLLVLDHIAIEPVGPAVGLDAIGLADQPGQAIVGDRDV